MMIQVNHLPASGSQQASVDLPPIVTRNKMKFQTVLICWELLSHFADVRLCEDK